MYPRISWELVADPLWSTRRTLGTAALQGSCRRAFCHQLHEVTCPGLFRSQPATYANFNWITWNSWPVVKLRNFWKKKSPCTILCYLTWLYFARCPQNYVSSDETQIEIRGSRISVAGSSRFLGYFAVSLGKYSKTCLKRTPYIPETWTNGKLISGRSFFPCKIIL